MSYYVKDHKTGLEMVEDNSKVKDALIFNLGTCLDCPSHRAGLCIVQNMAAAGLPGECYGFGAEYHRIIIWMYRYRQELYWRRKSAKEICSDIDAMFRRRRSPLPKGFRFNESSDARDVSDIRKMDYIAGHLKRHWGFRKVWTYTANPGLKKAIKACKYLVIKGSGWRSPHGSTIVIFGNDVATPRGFRECPGDCSKCSLCSIKGINLVFRMHGGLWNISGRNISYARAYSAMREFYGALIDDIGKELEHRKAA